MKERMQKHLTAKQAQKKALDARMIEAETKEERAAIGETLAALADEIADVEAMLAELDEPAEASAETENEGRKIMLAQIEERTEKTAEVAKEARAKEFAQSHRMTIGNEEARAALLVSGGSIAQPVGVSGINGLFPQVSSIVDMVKVVDASNMGGGYKIAYQITDASATAHTEGADIAESEPTFGLLTVTANDVALVSYISNKVRRQSPLTYEQKVRESATTALRRHASATIVASLNASTITEVVEVSGIDATTLRKIALSHGGDEAIVGSAVLMLNKADLIAFGDVRGTNEKKAVYEITPDAANPNTGIIKDGGLSVRYVINNNCPVFATAEAGAKCMFYGNPQTVELAMFGDYEVATSEDFKFGQDMLTVRGTASMGAALGVYKGFVAVSKQA